MVRPGQNAYVAAMTLRAIPLLAALLLVASPAFSASAKPSRADKSVTVSGLLLRAHAATVRGDTELALRLAQSAIVADPARPGSYVALGDIYAAMGQAEFAQSYYDAALAIEPTDTSALKAQAALGSHPASTANARP